ncbi:hypothetical protein [Flavobacterium hibisci]|uniref:hypothetical protein n=1 Tax=Flavobacterium hibisci TaxID=1914462 RepID=UPI001CC18D4F|nr:hypothetical protein [Flavobacterium hibisci]MBZ4041677.1 hypothetical protein [Flavobacterium hibisci]
MKQLRILSVVFILFGLFGFRSEKTWLKVAQEIPPDFSFVINSGGNDAYNSQFNSFYRKYLNEEKTVKVELTLEEKRRIFDFIKRVDFFNMPMIFEPTGKSGTIKVRMPSFQNSISVFMNGKKKYVSYENGFTDDLNEKKVKPFLDLYKMIWDILEKKEEIKKMPKSDYFYE